MDIIGKLNRSSRGNAYVLTIIDYATRYPEAITLPSIETERVCEALIEVFSRVGIPDEIITDQGSNFMSELMTQFNWALRRSRRVRITPWLTVWSKTLMEQLSPCGCSWYPPPRACIIRSLKLVFICGACIIRSPGKPTGQTLRNSAWRSRAGLYPCRPLGVELAIYNLHPRHSQGVREIGTEMIWGWSLPECFAMFFYVHL